MLISQQQMMLPRMVKRMQTVTSKLRHKMKAVRKAVKAKKMKHKRLAPSLFSFNIRR